MKLLVFAHTPPPHHGQSYMVQLMLGGFGGDQRAPRENTRGAEIGNQGSGNRGPESNSYGVVCYHVDARLSQKLEDIGDFRIGKFLLLLSYCFQAIWCRIRYGQRVVMTQDACLEVPEVRAGIDTELGCQQPGHLAQRGERIGLSSGSIHRHR